MTPAAGQPARAPLGIDQLQLGLVAIAILAAGLYLLVHGSAYCAPFLVLGLIYAIILTRPPTVEAIRTGAAWLIVFLIGWSIFAIVRHTYHYALADAAYALWLFTAVGVLTRRLSKRTVGLTYSSHVLVIAGLVLVALPWQADTPIVAAGVAAIGATLASAAVDYVRAGHVAGGPCSCEICPERGAPDSAGDQQPEAGGPDGEQDPVERSPG